MELLVAVLVMSVGVLGVVGLLTMSMQGNRSAALGTEAASLVEDMMDRMRVNAAARALWRPCAGRTRRRRPPDCSAVACTNEQMAMYDQAVWKCRLGRYADAPVCLGLGGGGRRGRPRDSHPGLGAAGRRRLDRVRSGGRSRAGSACSGWIGGQVRSVSVQSRI